MLDDLLIAIVLYKQNLNTSPSFITLTNAIDNYQSVPLLVYDNSPYPQVISDVNSVWDVIYIHNSQNDGISKAYNKSANVAESLNKKWLLFADQDTTFPKHFFKVLTNAILNNSDLQIFAPVLKSGKIAISPCWVYWEKAFPMKSPQLGRQKLENRSIINSGLCVSLMAFNIAGGYNNSIKLDFSDHYFIRALKKHYRYFYILEASVEHSLSIFIDNYQASLFRFKYYCDGARKYSNLFTFFPIFVITTYRMFKQVLLHRSFRFIVPYFKYYFTSHPLQ